MKSPRHRRNVRRGVGFRMLSKQAQERLIKYEYAVIWLMVLIAITSIVWSIALNILTGDFNNGIIGAKLIFRQRDLQRMDKRSKETFNNDLSKLINETYTEAALEARNLKTTVKTKAENKTNKTTEITTIVEATTSHTISNTTTAKPKKRIITHIYHISSHMHAEEDEEVESDNSNEEDDDENPNENATVLEKRRLDLQADLQFLQTMSADVDANTWRQSSAVQFVYSFPFLTEIMAIIWAAMCLVFQSGVKKYWGLPKPWRIVVPSIFVFTLMTLGSLIYTIIANRYLTHFCTNLRHQLNYPDLISCGQAMSVLRPIIKRHQFRHDVYLNLFRICYFFSFLLWAIALIVMVLRYVFAIDFQLVEVRSGYESPAKPRSRSRRSSEISAIKVKSPARQFNSPPRMAHVDERARHRSEDDFQSAKSNFSEAVTPLLEQPTQSQTQVKIV